MATSFDDKFIQCVRNLNNIDKPDYPRNETNLYADFVELLAIFSKGNGVAYGDIQDLFYGEPDENNSTESNDANESFLNSIFAQIDERKILFGAMYPFDKHSEQYVTLKSGLSPSQKLYIFLLLSSSLDIFKSFNLEITTDFEIVSCEVIKAFMPNAIVKPFGKISEYQGTAVEKIKKLATDIGLSVNDSEIGNISDKNVQERGLDIVSWIPFEDCCQNKVIYFCQCACGKTYEYKQHDLRRHKNYYKFYKTKPQLTLLIPYSLINPKENKFYDSDEIEDDYLVFERLRIISLIKHKGDILSSLKSRCVIEKCIQDYGTFK